MEESFFQKNCAATDENESKRQWEVQIVALDLIQIDKACYPRESEACTFLCLGVFRERCCSEMISGYHSILTLL